MQNGSPLLIFFKSFIKLDQDICGDTLSLTSQKHHSLKQPAIGF